MGQEMQCAVRFGGKMSLGKALLESEALLFRGDFRLEIPFRAMKSVSAAQGVLRVEFPDGHAQFELGPQAERWAEKILHPKSLIEKLGVKPGASVSVLGVRDSSFRQDLAERTARVASPTPEKESDFIFFAAEARVELKRLKGLVRFLKKSGAVWVVYPKGQPHITQADVMAAARHAGLVDVKVASFSATHTALKLVIPLSRR
ncbi:MAG TPA: hypothetical protein VKE24_11165 [Candidatus Acidoferrales bacterium]|nr:hypothetical protein [Candidatus Acidoferrales bacterium]